MDRKSQPSSQRVQDRSMGHRGAPQHQQPPPSFPQFHHPPTTQPPVQMPFTDPFQNRDPFMPSSAHSRRSSYGMGSAPGPGGPSYGERAWSAQPPAPTTNHESQQHHQAPHASASTHAASSHAPAPMAYPYDSARRRSVGAAHSPPRYATGLQDPLAPPPPPPSFASRTMPPPSPTSAPPNSTSFPIPPPRTQPPPASASPFTGVRDLSSFAPRSGPSMSISSLIGADSSRHGNQSPRTTATAPSPTIKPIHNPSSPQRARSASIRVDQGQFGRPASPVSMSFASRTSESRPPPPPPQGQTRASAAEHHQNGPAHHALFSQPNVAGFRPFQSSPSSVQGEEAIRHAAHAPPRPSSQPMHPHPQDQEPRQRQDVYDRPHFHPSFRPFGEHNGRVPATSQPPSQSHMLDRSEAVHEGQSNGHAGPPLHHRASPHLSQTARSTPVSNGQTNGRNAFPSSFRDDQPGLFRPAPYNPYGPPPPPSHAQIAHREDLDYRGPRSDAYARLEHRQSPTPAELGRFDAGLRHHQPATHYPPYPPHGYEPHLQEHHSRREGDELHHRALLGIAADMSRKNGRSSPLPQAVQGAQPRHVGPAADPSIKSEFGRMFPGLGLGVGSNTPVAGTSANGSATPTRMSPARQGDTHGSVTDNDGASTASRGNKRGRKARDESVKDDGDATQGRSTPTLSQQASKRAKTAAAAAAPAHAAHTAHHHHHHAHHPHHHHHHHAVLDEQAVVGPSPFSTLRFPPNASAPQPAPHHHHHHAVHAHAPHHHHHTPKAVSVPPQPEITVSNQAVLSSISHLPRSHLGSQLYHTNLCLPPRDSTPLEAKFHFRSEMRPIPHFEDKENCTFTIRVPRGYLRSFDAPQDEQVTIAGGLEEICRTRALWGTGIYTDDSDVVAAAVHSGWLRGDFGDYNEDLHTLFNEEDAKAPTALPGKVFSEKPASPVRPPPNSDLHITIVLLPPLTKYSATTQHHLRSREWGSHHDGMSYMIHSMQFIDEGKMNRFTERTAAAKHQRIAEDLKRRNEAAESLIGLLRGGNSVSVGA